MLNLPEFEEISYLADCRCLEEILWESGCERTVDGLFFQGRKVASRNSFHAFAEHHELDCRKYFLPDLEVMVASGDLFCPKRKRVVIYKDCAYQAPVFISVLKHRKIGRKGKKFLEPMLKDALLEGELFSPEICERHQALITSLHKKTLVAYWLKDESITINDEYLTKGIPAKILKHIISAYIHEGKTEFEYRELKRLFEISLGQKNSNFEVRFYRLVDKLKEECRTFRVEKTGRGKFNLVVEGLVEFKEVK